MEGLDLCPVCYWWKIDVAQKMLKRSMSMTLVIPLSFVWMWCSSVPFWTSFFDDLADLVVVPVIWQTICSRKQRTAHVSDVFVDFLKNNLMRNKEKCSWDQLLTRRRPVRSFFSRGRCHRCSVGVGAWSGITEAFLRRPSFPSQTMRVRSRAYVILTMTFSGCSVYSPVTSNRRSS